MITDNGEWIMLGTSLRDPNRLRNVDDLVSFVEKVGFVPLFSSSKIIACSFRSILCTAFPLGVHVPQLV